MTSIFSDGAERADRVPDFHCHSTPLSIQPKHRNARVHHHIVSDAPRTRSFVSLPKFLAHARKAAFLHLSSSVVFDLGFQLSLALFELLAEFLKTLVAQVFLSIPKHLTF